MGENADTVQVLDVREPAESTGPLGHIRSAISIALGHLSERLGTLDKSRPDIAVCRSGARSAHATNLLKQAGFGKITNLNGGMLPWRAEHHAMTDGSY